MRLVGVVELRCGPLAQRGVARLTVAAETSVVLVFLFMTGGTRARSGLESLGLVTVLAVHLPMPPLQPKRRAFVIETHGLPRRLGMAFVTGRPLSSLVRILARMAVVAM